MQRLGKECRKAQHVDSFKSKCFPKNKSAIMHNMSIHVSIKQTEAINRGSMLSIKFSKKIPVET